MFMNEPEAVSAVTPAGQGRDLDRLPIPPSTPKSKSQLQPELSREQLLNIARRLAVRICDTHFDMKRCRGCADRKLIEQLGLCDREDLDKQDAEMERRKSKSRSRGGGISAYFVPCRCGSCNHTCDRVYGPYFKIHGRAISREQAEAVDGRLQEKVQSAANSFKAMKPNAIFPWDPRWPEHVHVHTGDLDKHLHQRPTRKSKSRQRS